MTSARANEPIELARSRVLVTGVSGFIGAAVAARLVEGGAIVAGLSRTTGRARALIAVKNFSFAPCDLEDAQACKRTVAGIAPSIVVHCASRPDGAESFQHTRASIGANLGATVNLLESCAPGLQAFVYADSCKVYGAALPPYRESTPVDPTSSYGATKAAGWWVVKSSARANGFSAVALRPTLIYGPGQGMNIIEYVARKALANEREIVLDGGAQTRDPLFIDDAVELYLAAIRRAPGLNGRAIPAGGGQEVSVEALAHRIVGACGSVSAVRTCPERVRPTEIWKSWCDNQDANRLLDWSARTTLDAGLARTVAGIRAEMAAGT